MTGNCCEPRGDDSTPEGPRAGLTAIGLTMLLGWGGFAGIRFTAADQAFPTHGPRPPRRPAPVPAPRPGHLRRECTDRILIVNERHLARVLTGYITHYNGHRPHRALHQRPPHPLPARPHAATGKINRRPTLDGLINEHVQAA
jgi:putative transposase